MSRAKNVDISSGDVLNYSRTDTQESGQFIFVRQDEENYYGYTPDSAYCVFLKNMCKVTRSNKHFSNIDDYFKQSRLITDQNALIHEMLLKYRKGIKGKRAKVPNEGVRIAADPKNRKKPLSPKESPAFRIYFYSDPKGIISTEKKYNYFPIWLNGDSECRLYIMECHDGEKGYSIRKKEEGRSFLEGTFRLYNQNGCKFDRLIRSYPSCDIVEDYEWSDYENCYYVVFKKEPLH